MVKNCQKPVEAIFISPLQSVQVTTAHLLVYKLITLRKWYVLGGGSLEVGGRKENVFNRKEVLVSKEHYLNIWRSFIHDTLEMPYFNVILEFQQALSLIISVVELCSHL